MATVTKTETMGDVLERLGGIPADRVRMSPAPGTATELDLIRANDRVGPICELIDGTLVEKTMGQEESGLAVRLIIFLGNFVLQYKLGKIFGADGPSRLFPGQVRLPDVWFVTRERMRSLTDRKAPILDLAPDLAVEVLSKSNTNAEMERKLREYFAAGTRLVWYVDPKTRTVRAFTSPDSVITLNDDQTLDGGEVLPGFTLNLRELFAEFDD